MCALPQGFDKDVFLFVMRDHLGPRYQEMIAEVLTKRVPQERSDEDCLSD